MSAMTNYLEEMLGNVILRTQTAWKPAAVYIALHTGDPGEASPGANEVPSTNNYGRVQVAQADAQWTAPAAGNGVFANVNTITFPTPSGDWGTISHFSAWTASTSGDMLFKGSLTTPKTVNNGDPAPAFGAGALQITFA
jgi:hypothetical protein